MSKPILMYFYMEELNVQAMVLSQIQQGPHKFECIQSCQFRYFSGLY